MGAEEVIVCGGEEETMAAAVTTASESGSSVPASPRNKVKLLCSHGGKILPRPTDGHLKYVGGETRIVSFPRDINFSALKCIMDKGLLLCSPRTAAAVDHPSRPLLGWTAQISPQHLCIRTVNCLACKMKFELSIRATDGSDGARQLLCGSCTTATPTLCITSFYCPSTKS